ncbi:MAG: BatD family protein, partial [Thermoanaerobaculia bacterium]|nr:BatD family protein [Thermoanaerobaculia bacterium]
MRHARLLSRLAPALLMGAWAVAAAAQELRIELDRPEISVEEEAVLVVTVEGAGRAEPTLSPPSGLELRYGGRRNEMEWINGRVSRRVVHTWSVRAGRPGEYRIGPAEAEVDGELLTSNVVDLRVVPASAAARDRRDVFVTAQVSDDSPFVGEQVVFVWRLFSAVPLRQASLESQDL